MNQNALSSMNPPSINKKLSISELVETLPIINGDLANFMHSGVPLDIKIQTMQCVVSTLFYYASKSNKEEYLTVREHYLMWQTNLDEARLKQEQEISQIKTNYSYL